MRVCMGKGPYIWGDKERSTCIHTYKFVESAPNVYVCLQTCVVNICLHVFMVLQENICMYFHQNWRFQHALMHVHFHETSWGPGRFCWYSITSCIAWQREAGKVAVMQWEHERPETGKNGSSAQAVHPWKSTLGIANSGSTWKDVCGTGQNNWNHTELRKSCFQLEGWEQQGKRLMNKAIQLHNCAWDSSAAFCWAEACCTWILDGWRCWLQDRLPGGLTNRGQCCVLW